jgi:predicted methyltransferase
MIAADPAFAIVAALRRGRSKGLSAGDVSILCALAAIEDPQSTPQLVALTAMQASTVLQILRTLENSGLVTLSDSKPILASITNYGRETVLDILNA